MSNLNTRTTQFNIVISLNDIPIDFDTRLNRFLNDKTICDYAYIKHDKDFNKEGVLKTPHIHLLIWNYQTRTRFITMINLLSVELNTNPLAISIEKIVSLNGSMQYLLHKNDIDKTQYDINEIQTNISIDDLQLYLNTKNDALTFDRLYTLINVNKCDLCKIINELGLSYYRAYRPVIHDIINEIKRKY